MHLTLDLLLMVIDGQLPPAALARVIHEHLLETCEQCRLEWEAFANGHDSPFPPPPQPPPAEHRPLPDDPDDWSLDDLRSCESLIRNIESPDPAPDSRHPAGARRKDRDDG